MNPFDIFHEWHRNATAAGTLRHANAMCLCTVDSRGAPDARHVDLKEVSGDGFVFCTHLESAKARQLAERPDVALVFWWDHVERQVRVVGTAARISDAEADVHFAARGRDAQLTTWASQQSAPLPDAQSLESALAAVRERFDGRSVPRPDCWGGYRVIPSRFEFLTFEKTRLHHRMLFERHGEEWSETRLQP